MLHSFKYKNAFYGLALLLPALLPSCSPQTDFGEIGAKPKAAFTITPVTGKVNTYLLNVTTPGAFHIWWDLGGGKFRGKTVDTAYFPDMGDYTVKLTLLTDGGVDSAKADVKVLADDPNGCQGNKQLLTGCDSKTWVLDHAGTDALWVGDPGGGKWWSSGPGDVTGRPCSFNDEYTFKKDGTFLFDSKGDIRVDDEGGNPWPTDIGLPVGCATMAQIPAKYQAWGSGTHKFRITTGSGGVPGTLKVMGLGAYMALYKAGQDGTTGVPESEITYEIMSMTANKLVIRKLYSWGQWRFVFIPKS